jgi:hypothetical protein
VTGEKTWGFHHTPESKAKVSEVQEVMMWFKGQASMTGRYRSWCQDLINVWTVPATMLKIKLC